MMLRPLRQESASLGLPELPLARAVHSIVVSPLDSCPVGRDYSFKHVEREPDFTTTGSETAGPRTRSLKKQRIVMNQDIEILQESARISKL